MSPTRDFRIRAFAHLVLALTACLANHAWAATYTVGSSATACNYTSLQGALDGIPSSDHDIHILLSTDVNSVHVVFDGKTVVVEGGFANCLATTPTPGAINFISGSGHTGDSVIKFTGATVATLQNVGVYLGSQGSDSHGGGINFTGHGSLTLLNTDVEHNSCGYGAGMNVSPDGATIITLGNGTTFANNTAAHEGGGIRVEGQTQVYITGGAVEITDNVATDGNGGGIDVIGPARVDVDSSGYIHANTAKYGGGIAVTATSSGNDALLRLYSTNASRPVSVSANRATENGGGVYLDGLNTVAGSARARMCAYDFQIDGNFAKEGVAIYAEEADLSSTRIGSSVYLNQLTDPDGVCVDHRPLSTAVRCSPGANCNSISNGRSEDSSHASTGGSTLWVREDGHFLADNLRMNNNDGGFLLHVATNKGVLSKVRNCLITNNRAQNLTGALIKTDGNSPISFANCTLADNFIIGSYAFAVDDDFSLQRSILSLQLGDQAFHETDNSSTIAVNDVVSTDINTLPFLGSVRQITDARFMDPGHGDYHLQAASLAVDATPVVDGTDLDGLARGVDLAVVKDFYGPTPSKADLGAYERQSVGNLVLNSGFDTDLRLWSEYTSGIDQWLDATSIFNDTPYMRIYLYPATAGDHLGLQQCVPVPGASAYQLTGRASGNSVFGAVDTARIHWKFFASSSSCTGTATGEGDLYFPVNNGFLVPPLAPATIDVTAAQWGHNSAIQLTLINNTDVAITGHASVSAFDDIDLEPAGDKIFKDGFEGP